MSIAVSEKFGMKCWNERLHFSYVCKLLEFPVELLFFFVCVKDCMDLYGGLSFGMVI